MAMASPSESRNMTSDDTEVTSEHRHPDQHLLLLQHHSQQQPVPAGGRALDLEVPLPRQASIYSLTLDEIQNTMCEQGKTFGSMNMDEFLTNIWNAEEGQVNPGAGGATTSEAPPAAGDLTEGDVGAGGLRRQSSLSIPEPLCRKTVDEVWSEISRGTTFRAHLLHADHADPALQQITVQQDDGGGGNGVNAGSVPRQPTFGEMTLEDFLIKAGVVREGQQYVGVPPPHQPPPEPVGPSIAGYQIPAAITFMDHHHHHHHHHQQGVGHPGVANGVGGYPVGNGYGSGGMMGNGYAAAALVGSPASPGGSSEMEGGQVDNSVAAGAYGPDGVVVAARGIGGRKRSAENGSADRVVERRQRRMIKNRESAARSRARKQAYTVELEAELNQLKEENARLREEQKRTMQMRKQLLLDSMAEQAQANAGKTVRLLQRCKTCPW